MKEDRREVISHLILCRLLRHYLIHNTISQDSRNCFKISRHLANDEGEVNDASNDDESVEEDEVTLAPQEYWGAKHPDKDKVGVNVRARWTTKYATIIFIMNTFSTTKAPFKQRKSIYPTFLSRGKKARKEIAIE